MYTVLSLCIVPVSQTILCLISFPYCAGEWTDVDSVWSRAKALTPVLPIQP